MDQQQFVDFLQHPLVQGTISGLIGAVAVDFAAFRSWKKWDDAATYDWATASFRWVQGLLFGFVSAAGVQFGAYLLS